MMSERSKSCCQKFQRSQSDGMSKKLCSQIQNFSCGNDAQVDHQLSISLIIGQKRTKIHHVCSNFAIYSQIVEPHKARIHLI